MTPLPSREQAQQLLDQRPRLAIGAWFWELVDGRASGRLVDREAIDYEAAVAEYERWADHAGDDTRNLDQALADVIDAALGEA